MPCSAEGFFQA